MTKAFKVTVKAYYRLTKPGIIQGNLIACTAGFLLASQGRINLRLLASVLIGTSLVIASACVCNNVIDRDIDQHMSRTRKRALATGSIKIVPALVYAALLALCGFGILLLLTNALTALVGLIGWIDYVILYGIAKRRGPIGTIVGSFAGATPPVAGYIAVTNHFDMAAILLFLFLLFWQMPHFYAISIYRLEEYKQAGIPVLPSIKGLNRTKLTILGYILATTVVTSALTFLGYTGIIHFGASLVLGLGWFIFGLKNYRIEDKTWGKQMFVFSLIVLTVLNLTLALDAVRR